YSRFARYYDGIFARFFLRRLSGAISALDIKPGARVLEIGVGTRLSLAYYPGHCEVVGVDIAPGMLERATQKVEANRRGHRSRRQMDAMHLDLPEEQFDYITMFHVITVVPDPWRLMRESLRVLRPKGEVLLINHFRIQNPILGGITRLIDPVTRRMGW